MITEALAQAALEIRSLSAYIGEKIVTPNHALHRERGRAGEGMAGVSVAVLEARPLRERLEDFSLQQQRADRRVAAAEAFGNCHQVGADAFLLARMQRPGAAHAAHDLVEDQENAVPVADAADRLEIAGHRRHRAHGGADDRLGHEGDDVLAAELLDLDLELAREP